MLRCVQWQHEPAQLICGFLIHQEQRQDDPKVLRVLTESASRSTLPVHLTERRVGKVPPGAAFQARSSALRVPIREGPRSEKDCILGLAGDDVIDGLSGDDILIGGEGNDRLEGGLGSDVPPPKKRSSNESHEQFLTSVLNRMTP